VREEGGCSLVVAHGHALVYQPLHEGRGPGTRVWFTDGPEGVVHVEVAGDDYGDVLWDVNIAEAVYRPVVAVVSSPLVVHVYYECGGGAGVGQPVALVCRRQTLGLSGA